MHIHLFDKDPNPVAMAAGETVFRQGDPGKHMHAVIEGAVDIVIHGQTVETVGPGGVFGEMALIEDQPRNATALVTADAKLVSIDRNRFTFLVQQHPFFSLQIMTIMAERLRKMNEKP